MRFKDWSFVKTLGVRRRSRNVLVSAQTCGDPFDLFFILDGSDSLSDNHFRDMKRFVMNVSIRF